MRYFMFMCSLLIFSPLPLLAQDGGGKSSIKPPGLDMGKLRQVQAVMQLVQRAQAAAREPEAVVGLYQKIDRLNKNIAALEAGLVAEGPGNSATAHLNGLRNKVKQSMKQVAGKRAELEPLFPLDSPSLRKRVQGRGLGHLKKMEADVAALLALAPEDLPDKWKTMKDRFTFKNRHGQPALPPGLAKKLAAENNGNSGNSGNSGGSGNSGNSSGGNSSGQSNKGKKDK